jgi:CIC family chloride channel protein
LKNKAKILAKYFYLKFSRQSTVVITKIQMTEFSYMIIMAIIIGIVAGFGAVGVKYLIEFISNLAFSGQGSVLEKVIATPWYILLIIPVIGGLFVGLFANFVVPESKGHGVTEVIQSILTKGGIIKPIVALGKSITSAVTIGTGGSVGYEGPIVQIGASIGSSVGQFFRVPTRRLKTLVGCGAAAGIAATFNMPIAGALFAVEVIMMDYAAYQLFPIIISSVIATVISHHYFGNFAEFQASPIILYNFFEIINFFILGLLCGLVSYLMIKSLYFFEDFFHNKVKIPVYLKPAVGGLLIGGMGIFYPEIIGVGNDSISHALSNSMIWYTALALIFIKILSTSLTLGSGGSGGMLSPALFVGAMTGFTFGTGMNFVNSSIALNSGSYAFIAMGGLIAGTVRAPLTAILMVFELTRQSSSILPLMIVVTISMILSTKLSRESVYTLKLLMNKIKLKTFGESSILKSIPVSEVYTKKINSLPENANYSEIVNLIISINEPCISVISLKGKFMGIISINILKESFLDKDILTDVIIAGDIADMTIPKVTKNHHCYEVMDLCRIYDIEGIPVVDENDNTKLIGMIWMKDINDNLQLEVDKIELTSDLASKISQVNKENDIPFLPGYVIAEVKVPHIFVGRSIAGLKVRTEYGIEIISIKQSTPHGQEIKALPKADYIIQEFDSLIIAGEAEKVNILKDLR